MPLCRTDFVFNKIKPLQNWSRFIDKRKNYEEEFNEHAISGYLSFLSKYGRVQRN